MAQVVSALGYEICSHRHVVALIYLVVAVSVRGSRVIRRGLVDLLMGLLVALVGLLVLVVVGLALVLDISNVTRVAVDLVVHGLGPAVREEDMVRTVGVVAIPILLLAEVKGTTVSIVLLNTVGVVVLGRTLLVLRLMVLGLVVKGLGLMVAGAMAMAGAAVVGKSNSNEDGEDDEGLKDKDKISYMQCQLDVLML